ncbi:MAG TPA: TraM recognition domain-containing protein [Bryobacteraceae bacterium]|nr:TraM recognition domain-containing protein [Bryobacteraceae bacterium]
MFEQIWNALSTPFMPVISVGGGDNVSVHGAGLLFNILLIYAGIGTVLFITRCLFFRIGYKFGFAPPGAFYGWTCYCPWRSVASAWLRFEAWRSERRMMEPSGGFASDFIPLIQVYRPGDLLLCLARIAGFRGNAPLALRDPQKAILVTADPGAGKTAWLTTLVATHLGPSLVFDPDGTMTTMLHRRLGSGGNGIVPKKTRDGKPMKFFGLDPRGLVKSDGFESGQWNFMDEVIQTYKTLGSDLAILMLIKAPKALIKQNNKHQAAFVEVAQTFWAGLTTLVLLAFPEECSLVRARQLLTQGWVDGAQGDEDPWTVLLKFMQYFDAGAAARRNPHGLFPNGEFPEELGDMIRAAGSLMLTSQSRDSKNPFRTAAIDQTSFMDLPEWRRISRSSSFTLRDLKEDLNMAVIVPVSDLKTIYSGWCSLITDTMRTIFENTPPSKHLTLCCIDECPSIAPPDLPNFVANCRRWNARAVIIGQNKGQFEHVYRDEADTLFSSSEAQVCMGNEHLGTLNYWVEKINKTTRGEKVKRPFADQGDDRYQNIDRGVTTDSLNRFLNPQRRNIIAKIAYRKTWRAKQARYNEVLPVWYYEPHPYYRETWMRAITRRIVRGILAR